MVLWSNLWAKTLPAQQVAKTHVIFYFCVGPRDHEQLHYLVSVETHCIVQGCVPFLRVQKKDWIDGKNKLWRWITGCWAAAYPVPGVDFGTTGQEVLHNGCAACSCGHMQGSAVQLQCGRHLNANPHTKHKKGPTVHQYKIYCVFTDAHVSSNSGAFTLSLTFRSAPWLFRALTTSRLPPLQAQCTALEPSWNTVGGPYPIYTADLGPRVAGALVCDDNLTQSHHHHPHKQAACPHVLLYLILKVDIGSFL